MKVHTDFTSGRHTLVFENQRISLNKSESRELDRWLEQKIKDAERQGCQLDQK